MFFPKTTLLFRMSTFCFNENKMPDLRWVGNVKYALDFFQDYIYLFT